MGLHGYVAATFYSKLFFTASYQTCYLLGCLNLVQFSLLTQVDKWDGCAVKNALDDTVKKIMIDTYGYSESHALMDGRLVICTVACLFALFAMVCDTNLV